MTSTPTASADGVTIPLPEGWEVVDLPGAQLAIAGPAGMATADGTQFRPSVNVVVAPAAPDADIRTLGTEAVAAAHVVAPGTHVLSYDLWPLGEDVYGRRLQFAYQEGDVPLCISQWIGLRDGAVTTVTATSAITQLRRTYAAFEVIATAALTGEQAS